MRRERIIEEGNGGWRQGRGSGGETVSNGKATTTLKSQRKRRDLRDREGRNCDVLMGGQRRGYNCEGGGVEREVASDRNEATERERERERE